jgi:hypothetical protein
MDICHFGGKKDTYVDTGRNRRRRLRKRRIQHILGIPAIYVSPHQELGNFPMSPASIDGRPVESSLSVTNGS